MNESGVFRGLNGYGVGPRRTAAKCGRPTAPSIARGARRRHGGDPKAQVRVTSPVPCVVYDLCMRRPKQTHARTAGTKTQARGRHGDPLRYTDANFEILRARKRPLSRAGLQARAGEAVTDLIWAVCRWGRGWTLGEYRFVVFSTDPSEDVNLYVQFWSEPQEEVCWEVCSGKWNPPADEVMAGAPSEIRRAPWLHDRRRGRELPARRLDSPPARCGAGGHGGAGHLRRRVGYRGLTSIDGHLVSDSHGEMQRVHGAFTPEDLCKTVARLGWIARLRESRDQENESAAVIDVQRGRACAQLVLSARVPGQRGYQSAFVDVGDPLPADEARTRVAMERTPAFLEHAPMRVGRTLYFAGGVTADWLLTQVAAALAMAQPVLPTRSRHVH